ncbi:MAG: holo-ACP synthase [Candidatus Aminicenantes bacterium]|nr:holo-ACP synthase [Candidatus Aminicenantes bacterium]
MIYGVGIDMIETARVEKQLLRNERFRDRVFSPFEIEYCESKKNKAQNYAARFAAKEAFMKALGIGWRKGLSFKDIEVRNDDLGKPTIVLHGKARDLADERKIRNIQVSLTHLKDIAGAHVTIEI